MREEEEEKEEKKKRREWRKNRRRMCAGVLLVQSSDFVLADKKRSVSKFFDEFTKPSIVRIVQVDSNYELSAPQLAKNANFWVFDKHRQKRVLFRSSNDQFISISFESTVKFHTVHRHTAGPALTLKELFKSARNVTDIKVALDNDPDLVLSNRPDLNNAVAYRELTAVAILEEAHLVCQALNGSTLESGLTLISTKAPLTLDPVIGIRKRSSSYFRQWTDALRQQQIQMSTSPSATSDVVLLCGKDDGRHSSLLYFVNKHSSGVDNVPRSPATTTATQTAQTATTTTTQTTAAAAATTTTTTAAAATIHLESGANKSDGAGNAASGGLLQVVAENKRPDVDSLRKRFELTKKEAKTEKEEDMRKKVRRGASASAQVIPSRELSDRVVATLPPYVSNFRSQQQLKTRSMSREDILGEASSSQSRSLKGIQLNQAHTRSLADLLGDETSTSSRPPFPPPSTTNSDPCSDEDNRYETLREIGGVAPSLPTVQGSTWKGASPTSSDPTVSIKTKVGRSSVPDPPKVPSNTSLQPKPKSQTRSVIGLLHRKKKKEKALPPPGHYEQIKRASAEDHEYVELIDPEQSSRIGEVEKRRKWKSASDIPLDMDVASLTVDEVAHCLELLKLRKYARKFRERIVDGAILVTVSESMLVDSFKMDQIDARKLIMFTSHNWRPSK